MKKKYPEKLKIFEEVKNREFKEEEPEEPKKYYNYFDENGINKFTNTKYDPKVLIKKVLIKKVLIKKVYIKILKINMTAMVLINMANIKIILF